VALDDHRHPDCRTCTERERLSLGQIAEIKALKAKVEPVQRERDTLQRQLDELLGAVEPFAIDGGVSCGSEEVDRLYDAFQTIRAEQEGK